MRRLWVVLAAGMLLFPAGGVFGQDSLNVILAGHLFDYWSSVSDIKVRGNYAFVLTNLSGLKVLDMSNPENPVELYTVPIQGYAWMMDMEGDFLYITNHDYGLIIFDISDPLDLIQAGAVPLEHGGDCIDAVPGMVYVSHNEELYFINIEDPYQPELIYTYTSYYEDFPYFEVHGQFLFSMSSGYFYSIYDISVSVNTYRVSHSSCGSSINLLTVNGNYLYASLSGSESGVAIIDVQNPATPVIINFYELENTQELYYKDQKLYIHLSGQLVILDVTNPASPQALGNMSTTIYGLMYEDSGILYNAMNNSGYKTISVSDPTSPYLLYSYDNSNEVTICAVNDSLAFVQSDFNHVLTAVDISNPFSPEILGSADYFPHDFFCMELAGSTLYVNDLVNQFRAIDVSDPENIVDIANGYVSTMGFIYGAVSDSCLLEVNSGGDLYVFTLPQNGNMSLIGQNNFFCSTDCITAKGDFAYFGNIVVDISDPANPIFAAELEDSPRSEMVVQGDYLYCVGEYIEVYDISDPYSTELTGCFPAPFALYRVAVYGNLLAASDYNGKIWIYDISDPVDLFLAGYYYNLGCVQDLDFFGEGNYLFAANTYNCITLDCSQLVYVEEFPKSMPLTSELLTCYPNPFNNRTVISFELPAEGEIELKVFDIQGREVAEFGNRQAESGKNSVVWEAEGVGSGVYFIQLTVDSGQSTVKQTQKVALIK